MSNTALVDHGFGWQRDYNHGHEREMEQLYDTNQTQIRIQDGAFTHSSQRRETHVIYQFIYIDANYKYNITYTSPKTHITSHTAYIICISYIIYPIYLILYMKSILSNTQASPPTCGQGTKPAHRNCLPGHRSRRVNFPKFRAKILCFCMFLPC